MKTKTDQNTINGRLLAFVTSARSMLAVSPEISLAMLTRQIGMHHSVIEELVRLGVIERPQGKSVGYIWKSDEPSERIVDEILIQRGRLKEKIVDSVPTELLVAFEKRFCAIEDWKKNQDEGLGRAWWRDELENVKKMIQGKNELGMFSDDDRTLVEMAINDTAQLSARFAALEANVTELIKRSFSPNSPSRDEPLQRIDIPKKFKIGIVGVYDRDWRHIIDHMKTVLNGQSKNVEMVHIRHDHFPVHIPSGLDGVIVTDDGFKRGQEARVLYPRTTFHIKGGIKSIVDQVSAIVRPTS